MSVQTKPRTKISSAHYELTDVELHSWLQRHHSFDTEKKQYYFKPEAIKAMKAHTLLSPEQKMNFELISTEYLSKLNRFIKP